MCRVGIFCVAPGHQKYGELKWKDALYAAARQSNELRGVDLKVGRRKDPLVAVVRANRFAIGAAC